MKKKLPVGIENFEEIRTEDFYYVDKTGFIVGLMKHWGKVNLFTRPRRFGKSLNMSMLKYFFSYGCEPGLFEGLAVAADRRLCEQYMGKFPVISLTLKNAASRTFEGAKALLRSTVGDMAMEFQFLSESGRLSEQEREQYGQLIRLDLSGKQRFQMSDETLEESLKILSGLLHKHYGQKVILLIDEYDVPLDKAEQYGYYDEMIHLIRGLLGQGLKTNDSLQMAVLTGCLRIAKESIFTGLNNFKVFSITDPRMDEGFGFSDREVREMLEYYGLAEKYARIREWYDGYRFGNADVYCPWDVINYVDLLRTDPDCQPKPFWINTSGNDIIRKFLETARQSTRREIERLIDGESVEKQIREELTYRDLYQDAENLWSVLFMTGYLTRRGGLEGDRCELAIPNREIRKIFIEQIGEWFRTEAAKDAPRLTAFCEALASGDAEAVERQFTAYLQRTISIRDTGARKGRKENFYHGVLLGILGCKEDWDVASNVESGEGYSDILAEIESTGTGIVIEVKYPDGGSLEEGCKEALAQIAGKGYKTRLEEDGMETILCYGIACHKKRCRVQCEKGL